MNRQIEPGMLGRLIHAQANADEELLRCGRTAFATFIDRPAVAALWWPRFEAMAVWLLKQEQQRRATHCTVFAELKGEWRWHIDGKPFTLTTRIDRLERHEDGTYTLIDYKTGAVPTAKDIERGLANQLAVEALILCYGVVKPAPVTTPVITAMEYWKLAGNHERCDIIPIGVDKDQTLEHYLKQTHARLEALIRAYDDPAMPYAAQTDPGLLPRYNDYAHLTRRQEWEGI